jgi:hypothetical protein
MYQNITHLNLLWRAREYHKKLEAQVQSLLGYVLSVLGGLIEIIKGMGLNVKGRPQEKFHGKMMIAIRAIGLLANNTQYRFVPF